jgi:diguanylate cyclase (GGDEF)-like protein
MIILVADDDATSRRLLENAVTQLGYEVVTATDGLGAWNLLRQQDIRMVIADWEMPGMNGLSLCRRIRSGVLPHYVFVILITSKDDRADTLTGLEAGADDYLTKPFDRAELCARLRTGQRIVDLEKELSAKNRALDDLNARLERMTVTDPLMNIGNRRGLYDALGQLGGGEESQYALVMCDVDDFKSYNDTYGHAAGDDVLRDISTEMKKCLREGDGLFRYGGEEIVAYLRGADLAAGRQIAERLCHAVEALAMPHSGSLSGVVTLSCGVAVSFAGASKARGWEEVLAHADEALYRAKSAGKNRVEAAQAPSKA